MNEGTFGVETIEQFLVTSYDQFAENATVQSFLPLLAERFARQRLKALAKVEGKASDGLPIVLSSACTTLVDPKWRLAGSTISPVIGQSRGQAAANRAPK